MKASFAAPTRAGWAASSRRRGSSRAMTIVVSWFGLGEQAEEIVASDVGQFRGTDALELGQHRRGVNDESRLVALAARGLRRQIGRVGFDEQPVERHFFQGRAQDIGFLE